VLREESMKLVEPAKPVAIEEEIIEGGH